MIKMSNSLSNFIVLLIRRDVGTKVITVLQKMNCDLNTKKSVVEN